MRRGENPSVQGGRRKDMQRIFDDERRRNGGFAPGPKGVGPKSPLTALQILESALHFLAVCALSGTILAPTHSQSLIEYGP
jgi:hypothetical protein